MASTTTIEVFWYDLWRDDKDLPQDALKRLEEVLSPYQTEHHQLAAFPSRFHLGSKHQINLYLLMAPQLVRGTRRDFSPVVLGGKHLGDPEFPADDNTIVVAIRDEKGLRDALFQAAAWVKKALAGKVKKLGSSRRGYRHDKRGRSSLTEHPWGDGSQRKPHPWWP